MYFCVFFQSLLFLTFLYLLLKLDVVAGEEEEEETKAKKERGCFFLLLPSLAITT